MADKTVAPKKTRILICGVLPPPYFGHSMMYKMLMSSGFTEAYDVIFLNMHFWSYGTHKKVTILKLVKMGVYLARYVYLIGRYRPRYVLYNMSFYKMPFLKDYLFFRLGHLMGCRMIIHDMGQYVRELYDNGSPLYKRLVKKFCTIATASLLMGERTKAVYKGFMPPERLIATSGCVTDFYDQGERLPKAKDRIEVLYFSFLSRSKGVMTALKAVERVVKQNPRVYFTFGGPLESPALRKEIDVFLKERGLTAHVRILGYVDTEEKRTALMRQADIFIFPTHRDVFGLVLLHAMAEALPVIASIEGTIPEIVKDQETGILFPKGDVDRLTAAILKLAEDASLRRRMGQKGRERYLEYYTPAKYAQRMVEAFEKIETELIA